MVEDLTPPIIAYHALFLLSPRQQVGISRSSPRGLYTMSACLNYPNQPTRAKEGSALALPLSLRSRDVSCHFFHSPEDALLTTNSKY